MVIDHCPLISERLCEIKMEERGRVSVGGAGTTMLVDSKDRTVRLPQTQEPVYQNGIWNYNPRPIYSVVPVIETTEKENILIQSVGLYNGPDFEVDVIHLFNYRNEGEVCEGMLERSVDLEEIFRRVKISSSRSLNLVEEERLMHELQEIGDLERTLKEKLGNYRGPN